MKFIFSITFLLVAEIVSAQNGCPIITLSGSEYYGEVTVDTVQYVFGLNDRSTGDNIGMDTYYFRRTQTNTGDASHYVFSGDTLFEYYPAVNKMSKPMMYLKEGNIYLGSYYNQSNGVKYYVFDNTWVGIVHQNDAGGFSIESMVGASFETIVAATTGDCVHGLMTAFSYIFTPSELMDE